MRQLYASWRLCPEARPRLAVVPASRESARPRRRRWLLALTAAVVLWPATSLGQGAPEPALKAAFLLNFVRFTDWPAAEDGREQVLTLCVSDRAVTEALDATLRGQPAVRRQFALRYIRPADPLAGCAMVYVGRADARALPQLLRRAAGLALLTVSDAEGFVRQGGMIELYPQDGRMRFAINADAALNSGLQVSSNLLRLARAKDR